MKPVPTFSWEDIDSLRGTIVRSRPEGAFTAKEYAGRYGLKKTKTNVEIKKLVKAGLLEAIEGIEDGHTTTYYRRVGHAKETKQSVSGRSDG